MLHSGGCSSGYRKYRELHRHSWYGGKENDPLAKRETTFGGMTNHHQIATPAGSREEYKSNEYDLAHGAHHRQRSRESLVIQIGKS